MKVTHSLPLFLALLLLGCRYPNEFNNTQTKAPHAILRGTKYPNGGHTFATLLNGQPTSFWRSSDVFRIPPGSNNCQIAYSDRKESIGFKTAHFIAAAGQQYTIARRREPAVATPFAATPHPTTPDSWIIHDWRDRAIIQEIKPNGLFTIAADVPREDYVFGLTSSNLAIAKYHQRNH
jgi:hypothetical protein